MSDSGNLRQQVENAALVAAVQAVKSGTFDREIEAIVVDAVRSGSDTGLSRVGFVLKMAVEAIDRSRPRINFSDAKRMARTAYDDFRRGNGGVKFGDPEWDWSGQAARDIIHEYEISHWEPAP